MLRTLSEVKRVLKPGGKFYYMEHIIAPEVIEAFLDSVFLFVKIALIQGTTLRYLQQGLMLGGKCYFSSMFPFDSTFTSVCFFLWFQVGFKNLRRHYKCII